jgi:hypothetical protein
LEEVRALSSVLKSDGQELSTLPFYKDLLVSLAERERTLSSLLALSAPQSADELNALKRFLERYVILIEQLGKLTDAIAVFINKLRADGKWPIRGE